MQCTEREAISLLKQMGFYSLIDDTEAINAVITGVLEADWKFNPNKSANKKTFTINSARFKVLSLLKKRKKRCTVNYLFDKPQPCKYKKRQELRLWIEEAPLSNLERKSIQLVYLHSNRVVDVANDWNVSVGTIHDAIKTGIYKLKKYCVEHDINDI